MKTEEWRVVEGYEGIYAISDAGNVMSMNYQASGLPGLLTPLTNSRYARVCLYKKGIQMQTAALARLFGLHDGAAGRVISGKRWPHVPMEGKNMNVKLGAQLGGQAAKNRLSAG